MIHSCNYFHDVDNATVIFPTGFLPFGSAHGDSTGPIRDDDSTEEIQLETDIVIFGSHQNRLYVSHILISLLSRDLALNYNMKH